MNQVWQWLPLTSLCWTRKVVFFLKVFDLRLVLYGCKLVVGRWSILFLGKKRCGTASITNVSSHQLVLNPGVHLDWLGLHSYCYCEQVFSPCSFNHCIPHLYHVISHLPANYNCRLALCCYAFFCLWAL